MRDAFRIGLKPQEFWDSTPYEMNLMLEGHAWRRDEQGMMFANFFAANITPHLGKGKKVKPQDLYKPLVMGVKPKPKKKIDPKERHRQFLETVKQLAPDAIIPE